jgi:hypothetical protein
MAEAITIYMVRNLPFLSIDHENPNRILSGLLLPIHERNKHFHANCWQNPRSRKVIGS